MFKWNICSVYIRIKWLFEASSHSYCIEAMRCFLSLSSNNLLAMKYPNGLIPFLHSSNVLMKNITIHYAHRPLLLFDRKKKCEVSLRNKSSEARCNKAYCNSEGDFKQFVGTYMLCCFKQSFYVFNFHLRKNYIFMDQPLPHPLFYLFFSVRL